MRKAVGLTDSEWKIMLLLWERAPLTITQMEHALKDETEWSKHTIISFLKRMIKKNAIRLQEAQPAKLYYPNIEKKDVVHEETQSLLGKLYGGSIGLMVSSLIQEEEMSDEEIDKLIDTLRAGKKLKGDEKN